MIGLMEIAAGICPQLPLPPEEESPGVSSSAVRQAGRGLGRDHGGRLLSRPLPHRAEPAEEEKETEKQKKTTEGVECRVKTDGLK